MSQPRILMCRPEYYGIEYEINAWMDRRRKVDHDVAVEQWEALRSLLTDIGAQIELVEPVKGLPDIVFTANAAMIHKRRAFIARFRPPQRQGEERYFRHYFAEHGFQVEELPPEAYFEGAGDALFLGDTLVAGYRMRSDAATHQRVGQMLSCRVIPVELVNPLFYHLDTCLCPLTSESAICYPAAFDEYGRKAVTQLIEDLIELDLDEASCFAANAVVVGSHVITNTGCPKLHSALRQRGFTPIETPLSEFVKAGGSAKCLTLRLDGEEAASWKYAQVSGGA